MTTTQEGTELVQTEPRAMLAGMPAAELVQAATEVAEVLGRVIRSQRLMVNMGTDERPSEHVLIEGWLTAGAMLQTFPHVVRTEAMRDTEGRLTGFKAVAEARTLDGRTVSTAEALCTRDEKVTIKRGRRAGTTWFRWEQAPAHQLMSMAETRAASKAMGFALRWIITMAGFSGTPAEEMEQEPEQPEEPEPQGEKGYLEDDPELRRAVAPETEAKKAPRDPATRKRAARAATRPVPRQPSEAEAVPKPVPWEEFFRRHGIVAAQAVSIIRSAHPTALGPEEDEAETWPKVLELGEELPEGGKAEENHVAASRANEVQRAASKLTNLDPARAVAAQEMLVSIMREEKQ